MLNTDSLLLQTEALPVLLRHPGITQQQVVCRLLCLAHSARLAVETHCNGVLTVRYPSFRPAPLESETDAQKQPRNVYKLHKQLFHSFRRWLVQHGQLIRSLDVDLGCGVAPEAVRAKLAPSFPPKLAAALQELAKKHGVSLQLQSLRLRSASVYTSHILQQLSRTHLTQLFLHFQAVSSTKLQQQRQQQMTGIASALSRLTGLRSLTLINSDAQLLLPAIPALQQLTELSVSYVAMRSIGLLQQLPASLQRLHFNVLESYEDCLTSSSDEEHGTSSTVSQDSYGSAGAEGDDAEAEGAEHKAMNSPAGTNSNFAQAASAAAGEPPQQQQALPEGAGSIGHGSGLPGISDTFNLSVDQQQQYGPFLQAGHLSALTELSSHTYRLTSEDRLPPRLKILELGTCCSVRPVLQLQQLQHLVIHKEPAPAVPDLLLLRNTVSTLTALSLSYQGLETVRPAGQVWPSLPLCSLEIEFNATEVSVSVWEQIGRLQGLTKLVVNGGFIAVPAQVTAGQLGAVVQQLSNLVELELNSISFADDAGTAKLTPTGSFAPSTTGAEGAGQTSTPPALAAPGEQAISHVYQHSRRNKGRIWDVPDTGDLAGLVQAIADLPSLQTLSLFQLANASGVWMGCEDLAPLSAATKLTCLYLCMTYIDDACLQQLLCKLRNLKRLALDYCQHVTVASVPCIARELTQLTWLNVWGTGMQASPGVPGNIDPQGMQLRSLEDMLPGVEVVGRSA